jgi:hypothetical protein
VSNGSGLADAQLPGERHATKAVPDEVAEKTCSGECFRGLSGQARVSNRPALENGAAARSTFI